jgi:hypothetical protein
VLRLDALFAATLLRFRPAALEKLEFFPHAHRGEKLTVTRGTIYPFCVDGPLRFRGFLQLLTRI